MFDCWRVLKVIAYHATSVFSFCPWIGLIHRQSAISPRFLSSQAALAHKIHWKLLPLWTLAKHLPFCPKRTEEITAAITRHRPLFPHPNYPATTPSLYYLFILSCPGCLMGLWAIAIWFCGGWVLFVLVKKFAAMETDVSILTHHSFFYFLIFCAILKISLLKYLKYSSFLRVL